MVPPRPVQKSEAVRQQYSDSTYRNALEDLLHDFEDRCAYSLIHRKAGPTSQMHVDHFNPRLVHPERNHYGNLYPAHAHCNQKKSDTWPDPDEAAAGKRFIDPCVEADYGNHIFEDPDTHHLVAISAAGKLQIDALDLNNQFFVERRADRAEFFKFAPHWVYIGPESSRLSAEAVFQRKYDTSIPLIPPPPAGATLV